jgi:hypothetical protein
MMPDRNAGNAEAVGDVFIGKPFPNQANNFALSFG